MRRLAESDKLTDPGSNTWKAEPPTPHDLRRTFATRLAAELEARRIPRPIGAKWHVQTGGGVLSAFMTPCPNLMERVS